MNSNLILTTMCCLQTSIRGAFVDQPIPAPEHIFMVDQPETPFCLNHSFGTVRYLGSGPHSLRGLPTDCLRGKDEQFEIIVGVCAPAPPAVLAAQGVACSADQIYGECPPCGEQLEIQAPSIGGDCISPVVVDGKFSWPDNAGSPWSVTSFTGYLLVQRFILRQNLIKVFCKCFAECGSDFKGKAVLSVQSTEPWCDGQFQGTRLVVQGRIG